MSCNGLMMLARPFQPGTGANASRTLSMDQIYGGRIRFAILKGHAKRIRGNDI